jgi:hypothetical protein
VDFAYYTHRYDYYRYSRYDDYPYASFYGPSRFGAGFGFGGRGPRMVP